MALPLLDPRRRARPLVRAGDRARDAGRFAEAADAYARAVAAAPDWTAIWVQLGHMRKDAGDLSGAEAAYAKAVALRPADADAWVNVGHLMKLAGRPQEAADAYGHARGLDPAIPGLAAELAHLTHHGAAPSGRPPQLAGTGIARTKSTAVSGKSRRRGLFRRGPDPRSLKLSREGDAARDRRDWPAAAKAYEAALKIDPARPGIWVQWGHAAKEAGDFPAAEAAYQEALRREPGTGDTHLNLGHLRKLQGRPGEAYEAYKRAVELEPEREEWVRELVGASRHVAGEPGAPEAAADPMLAFLREVAAGASPVQLIAALPPVEMARVAELIEPAAHPAATPAPSAPAATEAPPASATDRTDGAAEASVVFDITDLLSFFRHSRLPTGIQRVQIETVSAVLRDPPPGVAASVCAFSEGLRAWAELPSASFLEVARLALASDDAAAVDWRLAFGRLELALQASGAIDFAPGATLVNLGASWEQGNYFLALRAAKARYGLRYVPFLHDLIPVFAPGFHVEDLTRDFIGWLGALVAHSDGFLANSRHTMDDLRRAVEQLGGEWDADRTEVIPLDARLGSETQDHTIDEEVLRKYGLERETFVLFVSTIEPRKNHLTAFGAWSQLLREHSAKTPKLVCVGRRGWLNEGVIARLENDARLREAVKVVSGVSDHGLATLYKACAFTLYPSGYEGWGLPITESLCYGKVPLTSDSPSLREAGGEFAETFELGSERRLAAAAGRLYFDLDHRRAREAAIAERFRPRRWSELGAQITGAVERWREAAGASAPVAARPFPLVLGRYYPLARNRRMVIGPELESGEGFRRGDGWNGPESWGAWTRPGPALIAFTTPATSAQLRVYLGLRGPPHAGSAYTVTLGGETLAQGRLAPDRVSWVCRTLPPAAGAGGEIVLAIDGEASWPLDGREERRTGSIGVLGFMVCEEGDLMARGAFVEEHLSDRLELLT